MKKNLARATCALLGLLLGAALFEGVARIMVRTTLSDAQRAALVLPYDEIPYRPHPYACWENLQARVARDGERHNAIGYRGPERPISKRPRVFRIACLGGSTTYTQRVGELETYPVQLEKFLREKCPDREIEVLNEGVKGYTSLESLFDFAFKGLDHQPDAIVLYHAVNDVYVRLYAGFRRDYLHCRTVWVEEDIARNGLLRTLEKTTAFPWLRYRATDYATRGGLYYWVYDHDAAQLGREPGMAQSSAGPFRDHLRAMCDLANRRGIRCVLVSMAQNLVSDFPDKPNPGPIDQMNDSVRSVAASVGAIYVDAAAGFPQADGYFSRNDQVHMKALGAAELARRIGESILAANLLEKPAAAPGFDRDASSSLPETPSLLTPLSDDERARIEAGEIVAPAPYFLYSLVPNATASEGLGPHDASGRRPVDAPNGDGASNGANTDGSAGGDGSPRRVICVGGSSVYGVGVSAAESWPARLQSLLRERGGRKIEVKNCGVPGYTSAETLAAAYLRDLPLDPELVIVGLDFEDALPRLRPGFRTDYFHSRRTFRDPRRSSSSFQGFLDDLVTTEAPAGHDPLGSGAPLAALRDGNPDPDGLVASPGPYAMYRNLRSLVDLARSRPGVKRVVLVIPAAPSTPEGAGVLTAQAADWARVIRQVVAETGVGVIDASKDVAPGLFLPGSFLLNAKGNATRAAVIADELIPK